MINDPNDYQLASGVNASVTSDGATYNLGQVTSTEQQPIQDFKLSRKGFFSFLTGLISGTNIGTPIVINAVKSPNNDVKLLVNAQGKVLTFSAPTATSVGVANALAVSGNPNRRYLCLVNTSANSISLGFSGNNAVLNSGITLPPNSSYEMSEILGNLNLLAINAIASGAGSNLSIQEAI